MIFVDRTFSQKIERTEALANVAFIEARQQMDPTIGANWIEVAGAYAMYDGAESPCTQTFGLGLFDAVTPEHLDELEAFFLSRGAPVFHEVSPMTDPAFLSLLTSRGYQPIELSSVLFREMGPALTRDVRNSEMTTRVIEHEEADLWARTSAAGWSSEGNGLSEFMLNFGRVSAICEGASPFLAEINGNPCATGMLFVFDDVCMLAGASTVPGGRNRGAQNALLRSRLELAVGRGCTLAVMAAAPGSQSQRNAQKNGFAIAYTRIKWQLFP